MMTTRRKFGLGGIAAIIATGQAPAAIVRSIVAVRGAMFSGGAKLSAKSYVQDGLIAMWDGIENAGWGTHDASATVWKDLVGNKELVFTTGISIIQNAVVFVLGESAYSNSNIGLTTSNVIHGEMCIDIPVPNRGQQYAQFAGSNTRIFAYASVAYDGISLSSGAVGHGDWPSGSHTMSVHWPTNELHIDSVLRSVGTRSDSWSHRSKSTIIGDVVMQSSAKRGFNGNVHSVRLYSRAITAAEIVANCAVDKQRFNIT